MSAGLVRSLLIGLALVFLGLFLLVPLGIVFGSALASGVSAYLHAVGDPDALAAIRLTLATVAIAVPVNTLFGVAAAWLLAKYEFPGRSILVSLIDLPFCISPVVCGLSFSLVFGVRGWFGPWLHAHGLAVVFDVPGVVMVTTFVTFPLVARETLTTMEAQGSDEEEAALTLGANAWQILRHVTLPKIRWGLFYGIILCNARAMGEFGAVSVVSGHVRGETNTMPLHIETLYDEYSFVAAFAVASLLTLLALVTIALKSAALRIASAPA
jgi:sulfate transport system permease protein